MILYVIAHEQLCNIKFSYTTSSSASVSRCQACAPTYSSPPAFQLRQSEAKHLSSLHSEIVALLWLKSSISTWLSVLATCVTLLYPSAYLNRLVFPENQPVMCKNKDTISCPKISAGLSCQCHRSLIQVIILQTLAADKRQHSWQSLFLSPFQFP